MGICVQLFLTLRCVHESHDSHHHPLIPCSQIPQKLPALLFLQFHVIGYGSGKVLVGILPPLPVRDICFHAQKPVLRLIDRLVCGDRDNINADHHVLVDVRKLRHHFIRNIGSIVFQIQHPAIPLPYFEIIFFKFHRIRTDMVLKAVPQFCGRFQIKTEMTFLSGPVKAVQYMEFFLCVQFLALGTQVAEMGNQPVSGTQEIIPCVLHVFPVYRDRHIQLPDHAVGSHCLFHKHVVDFLPVLIQTVILLRDKDCLFQFLFVQPADNDSQLGGRSAVKEVKDIGILQKHRFLIFLRRHFKVNVCKPVCLRILVFSYQKDPVFPDRLDRDRLLYALRDLKLLLVLPHDGF